MTKSKKYYWIFQLVGWGGFFLNQVFSAWTFEKMNTKADQLLVLNRAAGFVVLGLIITHFLRYILIKMRVLEKPVKQQICLFLVLTLAISAIAGVIELYAYKQLHLLTNWEEKMFHKSQAVLLINNLFGWFTYFIIWSAIYFSYHYVTTSQKQQIDTLKLKSVVKELELKTIKAHINPHFIFNSLNGIRALVAENPQRARTAITELSNILRSSINIQKKETVALEDELKIVKDYLNLEHMRFEDRLQIICEVDESTTHHPIPTMMLQMLAENAIKHGISNEVNGGFVKVGSAITGHYLRLFVQNSGSLKTQQPNGGFGIKSIKERLHLLYGDNATFDIKETGSNTVQATITIPLTT